MRLSASVLLACIIFLSPFVYGYLVGNSAYKSIVLYENKTLTEQERQSLQKSVAISKQVGEVTEERIGNLVKIKKERGDEVSVTSSYIFTENLKKIVVATLTSGISFIPIMFRTGLWLGYNYLSFNWNWLVMVTIEFSSYAMFATSTYYLLTNLAMLENRRKRFLVSAVFYIIAIAILFLSSYYEAIIILS